MAYDPEQTWMDVAERHAKHLREIEAMPKPRILLGGFMAMMTDEEYAKATRFDVWFLAGGLVVFLASLIAMFRLWLVVVNILTAG